MAYTTQQVTELILKLSEQQFDQVDMNTRKDLFRAMSRLQELIKDNIHPSCFGLVLELALNGESDEEIMNAYNFTEIVRHIDG